MEVDPTMPVIQNMLLLDSEGKRIAVKYFDQQWWVFERPCVRQTATHLAVQLVLCRATIAQQSNYEKSVFSKTSRTNARGEGMPKMLCVVCGSLFRGLNGLASVVAEVTMFDEVVVCYKFIGDLMFYVTGSQDENELILHTVLVAFYESVTLLLRCARLYQIFLFWWMHKVLVRTCCTFVSVRQFIWLLQCRSAVEKKTVLENLDLVLLAMDEIIDKG